MTKIAVVCSPGVGDAAILQIAAHHLALAGFDATLVTPHDFGRWLKNSKTAPSVDWNDCDAIYLQHDNGPKSVAIQKLPKTIYTFYGSYSANKHPPIRKGFDFVSNLNQTMVENVIASLDQLFGLKANSANGFTPPPELVYKKYPRRVAIHTTSGNPIRNWPLPKFMKVARWLEERGYQPQILSPFPSLEELASFIYESGFFIGNDSGPGHIASLLKIPHVIIGRQEKHMRHWRPGWLKGAILTPPRWVPNWKGVRLRDTHWKRFIPVKAVIEAFQSSEIE